MEPIFNTQLKQKMRPHKQQAQKRQKAKEIQQLDQYGEKQKERKKERKKPKFAKFIQCATDIFSAISEGNDHTGRRLVAS